MIITFAIIVAFIGADVIKNKDFTKETPETEEVDGTKIVSAGKVKSIEEFFISKEKEITDNLDKTKDPQNVSEFVLNNLFGNYNDLKNQNLNTPENIDILTTTIAEQTKPFTTIPNKYSSLDLNTFPDYRRDDVRKYGNQFSELLVNHKLLLPTIDKEDPVEYIKEYANTYVQYADALSKIQVPRSISNEHLRYVNNLYKISVALVTLSETKEDPIFTVLILNQYNQAWDSQTKILINIANYFELNDIIFSENETGIMWNNF